MRVAEIRQPVQVRFALRAVPPDVLPPAGYRRSYVWSATRATAPSRPCAEPKAEFYAGPRSPLAPQPSDFIF